MKKELTAEYLIVKEVKYEKYGSETVFSVSGIKKLFKGASVSDANVIEIDSEGNTHKFCRISDVVLKSKEE